MHKLQSLQLNLVIPAYGLEVPQRLRCSKKSTAQEEENNTFVLTFETMQKRRLIHRIFYASDSDRDRRKEVGKLMRVDWGRRVLSCGEEHSHWLKLISF